MLSQLYCKYMAISQIYIIILPTHVLTGKVQQSPPSL